MYAFSNVKTNGRMHFSDSHAKFKALNFSILMPLRRRTQMNDASINQLIKFKPNCDNYVVMSVLTAKVKFSTLRL